MNKVQLPLLNRLCLLVMLLHMVLIGHLYAYNVKYHDCTESRVIHRHPISEICESSKLLNKFYKKLVIKTNKARVVKSSRLPSFSTVGLSPT